MEVVYGVFDSKTIAIRGTEPAVPRFSGGARGGAKGGGGQGRRQLVFLKNYTQIVANSPLSNN